MEGLQSENKLTQVNTTHFLGKFLLFAQKLAKITA